MKRFLCYDTNDATSGKINVSANGVLIPIDEKFIPEMSSVTLKSSTSGSSKKFKITVNDSGTITATEITV